MQKLMRYFAPPSDTLLSAVTKVYKSTAGERKNTIVITNKNRCYFAPLERVTFVTSYKSNQKSHRRLQTLDESIAKKQACLRSS